MKDHKTLISQAATGDAFLILGCGLTGKAVAQFLDQHNLDYYIWDDRDDAECSGRCFLGHLKKDADIVSQNIKAIFPSPGVALTHPVIQKAKKNGVPVIGELELASFYLKGDFIAVTGTNGKSTTVRLINALLKDAGIGSSLKGNIGSPLIAAVNEPPKSFYVVEESSFQLELVGSLRHRIAICLNVTDDHFDRYNSMGEYAQAKANMIVNSTADDVFIYNADDRYCLNMSVNTRARGVPFSLAREFDEGAFVRNNTMVIRIEGQEFCFDLKQCSLKGLHNIENMLSALTAVLLVDHSTRAVKSYVQTLKSFVGLPHRLEKVLSFNGVDYYNDSKATNVGAVVMALASFDQSIILIAGGKDKFCDFSPLKGIVKGKVKKLILIGEAKERMFKTLKESTDTVMAHNMTEAVHLAHDLARSGEVVLLSPACSSYDQYQNYKERGLDFVRCVRELCRVVIKGPEDE